MDIYRQLEKDMLVKIRNKKIVARNAAVLTMKCLQIASGNLILEDTVEEIHDAKLQVLESIIEESCRAPVLVAYHFKADRDSILRAFKQAVWFDPNDKSILRRWNTGKIPVLVANPMSCGHGLDMQHGGNIIVFYGHWWSTEGRLQILERLGPMRQRQSGYDRPVFVYDIVAEDTLDEDVLTAHASNISILDVLMARAQRLGL